MGTFFCGYCGKELISSQIEYCPYCGKQITDFTKSSSEDLELYTNSSFKSYVNNYVGNTNKGGLNWKVLFSDIFKKHSVDEAEKIFISGTKSTTPSVEDISKEWIRPWLYFRVFLTFLATYVILYLGCTIFNNINLLPGLIFIGAMIVPISSVMLFTELNIWRNVSVFRIFQTFLIGGCASLFITLLLFSFITPESLDYSGAFLVGAVEEIGKALIIYTFLKQMRSDKILVGLLIGCTIGAGFAAFETAGYGLRMMIIDGWESMTQTLFLRNILTPGGHVAWGAITGAAISIACKGGFCIDNIFSTKFFRLFIIPIILHFIWDSPISGIGQDYFLVYIILIIVVWTFLLSIINLGLSEIDIKQNIINPLNHYENLS